MPFQVSISKGLPTYLPNYHVHEYAWSDVIRAPATPTCHTSASNISYVPRHCHPPTGHPQRSPTNTPSPSSWSTVPVLYLGRFRDHKIRTAGSHLSQPGLVLNKPGPTQSTLDEDRRASLVTATECILASIHPKVVSLPGLFKVPSCQCAKRSTKYLSTYVIRTSSTRVVKLEAIH